jgi:hypothetical protein
MIAGVTVAPGIQPLTWAVVYRLQVKPSTAASEHKNARNHFAIVHIMLLLIRQR